MTTIIEQVEKQLALISAKEMKNIEIMQQDKSTVWLKGMRFGKYEQKFTVALTATGKVQKASVRFYE